MNLRNIALILVATGILFAGSAVEPVFAADAKTVKAKKVKPSSVNRFNRLFKGASNFNLPPTKDGIHDPENPGTEALQTPKEAFAGLPKSKAGNRVNWVKALDEGMLDPRADRYDDSKKMTVLDLNIVRQVKGSMPDVVYPHKPHTKWLQCSNCHPKIFIPKKGANKISMAAILAGQYCGVCHGKVAFPISECRLCHSKNKTKKQVADRAKSMSSGSSKGAKKAEAKETLSGLAKLAASEAKDMSRGAILKLGETVYEDTCSGCHGEVGEGVPGTFPALEGSPIANGPAEAHIDIVLHGKDDTAMQPWKDDLSLVELAAVISFERISWGNKGGLVQPSKIKAAAAKAAAPKVTKAAKAKAKGLIPDMTKAQLMKKGAEIYEETCSGCHGENGEGIPDTFPALKGSKIANGPAKAHLDIVLNGKPETAMQAWKEDLSPEDIAAVVTFERNSWGNKGGDLVQPSAVQKAN